MGTNQGGPCWHFDHVASVPRDLLEVREGQQHVVGRVAPDLPHAGHVVVHVTPRRVLQGARQLSDDAATARFL